MLTLEKLQEQLKKCISQRAQAQEMFYRLTGAAQIIEEQINLLKKESEVKKESEDVKPEDNEG